MIIVRISKPRREIYKQTIRSFMVAKPGINNLELASEIGIHRNTITKLLEEIRIENERLIKERWTMLLNDVTDDARIRQCELNALWVDAYHFLQDCKPAQLVDITKANWQITKDLYRFHLEYMGIRQDPKSLVQINLQEKVF